MHEPDVFVGIDVSKVQLDVALRPADNRWSVSNDEPGIARWLSACGRYRRR
jgi:hypothetical protein